MIVVDEFLAAHPEYVDAVRVIDRGSGPEDCMRQDAIPDFFRWAVREKGADPVVAAALYRTLKQRFPAAFPEEELF